MISRKGQQTDFQYRNQKKIIRNQQRSLEITIIVSRDWEWFLWFLMISNWFLVLEISLFPLLFYPVLENLVKRILLFSSDIMRLRLVNDSSLYYSYTSHLIWIHEKQVIMKDGRNDIGNRNDLRIWLVNNQSYSEVVSVFIIISSTFYYYPWKTSRNFF
jgi:hypothetical protein